jgi:hypothetical protein
VAGSTSAFGQLSVYQFVRVFTINFFRKSSCRTYTGEQSAEDGRRCLRHVILWSPVLNGTADGNTVTDDTTLTTAPVSATMHPIAPSYASQFKHLTMSFPSENVLHVQLKRSFFSFSTVTEPPYS